MNNDNLIQPFGFSEMYEWADISVANSGLFVTFSDTQLDKIIPYGGSRNKTIIGISTVNSVIESDNPKQWKFAYLCNEVGDLYLQKERLAIGQKVYDQVLEFNYIQTKPWEHFIPIKSKYFDESRQYVERTKRQEWSRVNLMGKAIVRDNGECKPGEYCQPYTGKIIKNFGIAVPATEDNNIKKFYVLSRLTNNTILVLNK